MAARGNPLIDTLSPQDRSALMSRVRGKDTTPELVVRRLAHRHGYRFRLHRKDLPGSPDLVFPRLKKAIFVHGCFWHGHLGCRAGRLPKSRVDYWSAKISRNKERDAEALAELRNLGWQVLVIWECETKDAGIIERKLDNFISQ